jgi:hypothetical protein
MQRLPGIKSETALTRLKREAVQSPGGGGGGGGSRLLLDAEGRELTPRRAAMARFMGSQGGDGGDTHLMVAQHAAAVAAGFLQGEGLDEESPRTRTLRTAVEREAAAAVALLRLEPADRADDSVQ